ncbi:protein-glutamate O-methyltransferase CheR [Paracoccus sp. p4-l81]|uniref:CheR family methyltransferase n=1 Tax=Paracoccus sp. p4-l81 TaxID=3342806 RepID=UPI0035BA40CE
MSAPAQAGGAIAPPTEKELGAISRLLYEGSGIVLAPGKASMVQARLSKRMRALGVADFAGYLNLFDTDAAAEESRHLVSALTTNVTQFFRESHHFDTLRTEILPDLIARARAGGRVRLWSAGCSNGQEPYTIAMEIAQAAPDFEALDIRVLATDIDPVMVERGRNGHYEAAVIAAIPAPLRKKFMTEAGTGATMSDSLRRLVSFRELNLHGDWPMRGKFDVIFCRNVVIYFDAPSQDRLWRRFEDKMAPGGWLFVGHSERVTAHPQSRLTTAGITTYRLSTA